MIRRFWSWLRRLFRRDRDVVPVEIQAKEDPEIRRRRKLREYLERPRPKTGDVGVMRDGKVYFVRKDGSWKRVGWLPPGRPMEFDIEFSGRIVFEVGAGRWKVHRGDGPFVRSAA